MKKIFIFFILFLLVLTACEAKEESNDSEEEAKEKEVVDDQKEEKDPEPEPEPEPEIRFTYTLKADYALNTEFSVGNIGLCGMLDTTKDECICVGEDIYRISLADNTYSLIEGVTTSSMIQRDKYFFPKEGYFYSGFESDFKGFFHGYKIEDKDGYGYYKYFVYKDNAIYLCDTKIASDQRGVVFEFSNYEIVKDFGEETIEQIAYARQDYGNSVSTGHLRILTKSGLYLIDLRARRLNGVVDYSNGNPFHLEIEKDDYISQDVAKILFLYPGKEEYDDILIVYSDGKVYQTNYMYDIIEEENKGH